MRHGWLIVLVAVAGCMPEQDVPVSWVPVIAAAMTEELPEPRPEPNGNECPDCEGRGKVGDGVVMVDCQTCGGDGRLDDEPPEQVARLSGGEYRFREPPAVGDVIVTDRGVRYRYDGERDGSHWWVPVQRAPVGGRYDGGGISSDPGAGYHSPPRSRAPSLRRVLVFSASWCGPCQRYRSVWRSDPRVEEIDYDTRQDMVRRYGVTRVPTTVVLDGDRVTAVRVGALSASQYAAIAGSGDRRGAVLPRLVRRRAVIPEPPSRAYVDPPTHRAYVDHCVWHGYDRRKIQGLSIDELVRLHGWAHSGRLLEGWK